MPPDFEHKRSMSHTRRILCWQDGAYLTRRLVHGKDKGGADSACAHKAKDGSLTDVHVETVEHNRGEKTISAVAATP